MSTPREELHALVDSLSDKAAADLLPDLLPELRLLKLQSEARAQRPQGSGTWPPSWFGAVEGSRPDIAQRSEDILRDEFGRRE
jgi:hypothetical protein